MSQTDISLLVIAKEPQPGRVKTRLTPPCSPRQAADLAAASLSDTLAAVAATPAARRVLVFDGDPTDWTPAGFEVVAQRGDGLGERLAAAFADVANSDHSTALLVGMDSPQLTPDLLGAAVTELTRPGRDAVIAPTLDGGYWCVGFARPVPGAFDGVPMSTEVTYDRQRERFDQLGLDVGVAPTLRDVDDIDDAHASAAEAPGTRFAAALARCAQTGFGPVTTAA